MATPRKRPAKFPWQTAYLEELEDPIYFDWAEPEYKNTRVKRNPNHPKFNKMYHLLTWWHIRIRLLGVDKEGRPIIIVRAGDGEPIYMRFGKTIELYRKGKRIKWDEDVDTRPYKHNRSDKRKISYKGQHFG